MPREIPSHKADFIRDNFLKLGFDECARLSKTNKKTVKTYAEKFGLWKSVSQEEHRKVMDARVDMAKFHDIKDANVAYFLGFMWGDGSIRNGRRGNDTRLQINRADYNEISWVFNDLISSKKEIGREMDNAKSQAGFRVCHHGLYNFLVSCGFLEKSGGSLDKILRVIPDNLFHMFLRGFIDADGYIGKKAFSVSITSVFNQDWGALSKRIERQCSVVPTVETSMKDKNKYSKLMFISYDKFEKLLNFVYSDFEINRIGLTRKYDTYKAGLVRRANRKSLFIVNRAHNPVVITRAGHVISAFLSASRCARKLKISETQVSRRLLGKLSPKIGDMEIRYKTKKNESK